MKLSNSTRTYPTSYWVRDTDTELAYEIYTYFGRRVALFQQTRLGTFTPDEVRIARNQAEKNHGGAWIRCVQYVPDNQ